MHGLTDIRYRSLAARLCNRPRRALTGVLFVALLIAAAPTEILAAPACPAAREPRIPPSEEPVINIDMHKEQLLAYHAGNYDADMSLVMADAGAYVAKRSEEVKWPAVVLDIDETSLSNWANIKANNFGLILDGACDRLPNGPCGFKEWILQGVAPAIMPALDLFNAAKAKGVAVVFITGRRDRDRQATLWNLDRAGYEGWAKLVTRPDDERLATVLMPLVWMSATAEEAA